MSHQIFVQNILIQRKCAKRSSMRRVTDNSLRQETVLKPFTLFISIMSFISIMFLKEKWLFYNVMLNSTHDSPRMQTTKMGLIFIKL